MRAAARKSAGVVYRNRVADWLDKWLFFFAFLVGALGNVFLKGWGVSPWIVTAFSVGVMGLYALYVFGSRQYRLREDLAGDSLYYLGFLYTLTSLACALYAFMQDEGNTQGIIANFGIALATTILGMALRVVFSQMREDPVEIEHEARLELAEAVAHLKTELHGAVLEFNTFRRATIQSLEEGQREIQGKMRQAMTDSATEYATMVKTMASTVEDLQEQVRATLMASATGYADVARAMASTLEDLRERVHVTVTESLTGHADVGSRMVAHMEATLTEGTQHTRTLQEVAKKLTTATKSLLTRVERIEAPADLLERMFTPAMETLWTSLQHTLEQYNTIQAPQIDALQASMQQATEGLRVQATQLSQVQQILDAVATSAHMLG